MNKEWYNLYNNKSGVYKITCLVNNKIYIGSSINIYERWKTHLKELKHNYHSNEHLQNAWNLYGKDNFVFEVLELCDKNIVRNREQYYIDLTKCYDKNIGFNILPKVDNTIVAEETKKKISSTLIKNGAKGEKCYNNKYPEEIIKKAINMLMENKMYSEIIKETGLPKETISQIVYKISWKYLTEGLTFPNFSEHKHSILQEADIKIIIEDLLNGIDNKTIASKYNVAPKTISDIRNHKTWKYLTESYIFPPTPDNLPRGENNNNSVLTTDQVITIKKLIANGNVTLTKIAQYYGVSLSVISNIKNNKIWKHVII